MRTELLATLVEVMTPDAEVVDCSAMSGCDFKEEIDDCGFVLVLLAAGVLEASGAMHAPVSRLFICVVYVSHISAYTACLLPSFTCLLPSFLFAHSPLPTRRFTKLIWYCSGAVSRVMLAHLKLLHSLLWVGAAIGIAIFKKFHGS